MLEKNMQCLKKAGLKITEPRLTILDLMQRNRDGMQHFTAEDIYRLLIEQGEDIGLATVYRVLNQFDEAGILVRHNFEGNKSVFEINPKEHHDHIICLACGQVMEFNDDIIEQRQHQICKAHGIELENHSLYLYGRCVDKKKCQAHQEQNKRK